MIVNLRGTNGSGKSTVSRLLREEHPHELVVEPTTLHGKNFKKPNATLIEGGLVIVGRELSGCDGIYPQEIVEDMVRHWAPRGHLVWENVLVSGNIGRWGRLAQELEPINHSVWATLDTPYETCIERIYERRVRREAAGHKHRQIGGAVKEGQIAAHWRRCRRVACYGRREGFDVRWIDHRLSYQMVHDLLVRAGWNCPVHGLLLPEGPFLEEWTPSEDELGGIIKTCRLPWETGLQERDLVPSRGFSRRNLKNLTDCPSTAVDTISGWDPLQEIGDPFDE